MSFAAAASSCCNRIEHKKHSGHENPLTALDFHKIFSVKNKINPLAMGRLGGGFH